jgi:hypothetical protein
MNYISPFRYTLEGMCINELHGLSFDGDQDAGAEPIPPPALSYSCYNNHTVCTTNPNQQIAYSGGSDRRMVIVTQPSPPRCKQ